MNGTIRRNNGWIHGKSHPPHEADGDSSGRVLAWHAFQGVMLVRWDDFACNRFNAYWMPLSDLDDTPWICAMERPPTQDDTDAQNCILARDTQGKLYVTGYHQFAWNRTLTHWRQLPGPPSDAKELRQMR